MLSCLARAHSSELGSKLKCFFIFSSSSLNISQNVSENIGAVYTSLIGSSITVCKGRFSKFSWPFDLRKGTRDQDPLQDYQDSGASNLTNISEELGENYSESVNAENAVTKRNYGAGEKIIQITDTETTSVEFLFTIPSLFCTAMEGIARGQLFNAKVRIKIFLKSKEYLKKISQCWIEKELFIKEEKI